ncbi:Mitochondrial translocator assembly and maintenance protein 41-like [Stylophora pistillata]|uniref:Phosphatidate cytidylyltransferase, mitochondrial n=1 Tax=Stylophora pistillata TaxID=50429 RepID=A0A2B4S893_STYPI|nr:Mitochondrial translocator assembly and maintenance protein 41-like [Stylophora pistillata]
MTKFPSGVSLAFAYGSGIFAQIGNTSPNNMLDFVFVLENARKWHEDNMYTRHHPHHYSFVRSFGSRALVSFQDKFGAGLYYNTLVPMDGRMIKYGTISRENFLLDLNDWQWLYLAGRLHKPVHFVLRPHDEDISSALKANLNSALTAALLCLPEYFTEEELFLSIAGLSFSGDFRMVVGEDKNKIQNIVGSNFKHFQELYRPILSENGQLHFNSTSCKYHQIQENDVVFSRLMSLPKNVQKHIARAVEGRCFKQSSIENVLIKVSQDRANCSRMVKKDQEFIFFDLR